MGRVFAETEGGEKNTESDGETCKPESEGERGREGRISLGGKLVAQWGFLLEFNLSGWGRKRRREGRPGSAAVWNMCRLDV